MINVIPWSGISSMNVIHQKEEISAHLLMNISIGPNRVGPKTTKTTSNVRRSQDDWRFIWFELIISWTVNLDFGENPTCVAGSFGSCSKWNTFIHVNKVSPLHLCRWIGHIRSTKVTDAQNIDSTGCRAFWIFWWPWGLNSFPSSYSKTSNLESGPTE